jgi:type IV pilus assembly protein PilP
MKMFFKAFFAPFILLLCVSGCGDNGNTELQQWMSEVKKNTHAVVPKLTEPKVYLPVVYGGKAETDPFNPAKLLVILARLKALSNNGLAPDRERPKEALESFPLDSLKMVGTIEKKGRRNALIQVDKTIFQVKAGDHVGQDFGKIMSITDTDVAIKETVQDAAGEWTERE